MSEHQWRKKQVRAFIDGWIGVGPMPGGMTRDEHMAWCKARALEYVDRGELVDAVASMGSDLGKHPETKPSDGLLFIGMFAAADHDTAGVRRWIEGFR
jgi:hypothetical protein